jgi:glycosyltransferase involved in cell wall biosynthesis
MRILYENSLAHNPAGTGVFVRGLLAGLRKLPAVEIITSEREAHASGELDVGRKTPARRARNAVAHLRYYAQALPQAAREADCDVILCPTSLGPLRGGKPSVVTIFDLSPVAVPETLDGVSRVYLRAMLAVGVARAQCIATISRSVAREVAAHYRKVPSDRIFVAYPGPNPALLEATPVLPPGVEAPYLLMVGTVEPRKNHLTVLRALAEHVQTHPERGMRLVVAGSLGWRYAPLLRAIDELGMGSRVRRLGAVPPGMLKWLYEHAHALLFPSLYEGFGIPVLEAFNLQCPVVAARIAPVVELAGPDAALLLEPTDVGAWRAAIDAIAADRLDPGLRAAGMARAKAFSWENCARAMLAAARAAAASR